VWAAVAKSRMVTAIMTGKGLAFTLDDGSYIMITSLLIQ